MLFGDNFMFHATLGYIDVNVDRQQGVKPVAPLTPELTYSLSPEMTFPLASGASVTFRVDYAYRDEMWGEPSSDPGRMTKIEDRGLLNANIAWRNADEDLMIALYGRNITDEVTVDGALNFLNLTAFVNEPAFWGVEFNYRF